MVYPISLGLQLAHHPPCPRRSTKKAQALIAREMAPAKASRDMYVANSQLSNRGGMAVAVPGEIRGYAELLNNLGTNVTWPQLFEEAIYLARNGFQIGAHLANALDNQKQNIYERRNMRNIFWDSQKNDTYKEGELLVQEDLAKTLELIAERGPLYFYQGPFAEGLVKEINDNGGVFTMDDLTKYDVHWSEPVKARFKGGQTLYSVPPPGSGAVLAHIMQIMNSYRAHDKDVLEDSILSLHRWVRDKDSGHN